MLRRWIAPLLGMGLALSLSVGTPTYGYRAAAPAHTPPMPPTADRMPAEAMKTVSGIVKGAPNGKTYTVVAGKKTTMVDASKAVVRNKGKFASAGDLKPGAYIRAAGSMNGPTLMAKTIDIVRTAGGARAGGKMKASTKAKK